MKTKVLYFPSNIFNGKRQYYYNIYVMLGQIFNNLKAITVDEVDKYLLAFKDERFYIKELPYQLEIYNAESEYVYCINKSL